MTNDNSDHTGIGHRRPPGNDADTHGGNKRHEPRFGGFDDREVEDYEEPDRDTDFSSGFGADDLDEEEELDDLFADDDSGSTPSQETLAPEEDPDGETEGWSGDDEYYDAVDDANSGWPLRLIAVAAVAVILVAVGVYGVLKERTATQEELRELRATLATSTDQAEVRTARDALRELQQSYDTLAAEAEALARENRELRETVASVEAPSPDAKTPVAAKAPVPVEIPEAASTLAEALSMGAEISQSRQAPRAAETVAEPEVAAPKATPAKPAASAAGDEQAATASPPGRWFVNFGSYSSRSLAESWASRLRPARGEVIVAPGSKDDKTFYRVRVVGLSDKGAADLVARQLEAEMQVSRLWVGQE